MLVPVLTPISITKNAKTITLADTTGAYNLTSNPGGYGAPNLVSPPTRVGFTVRFWTDTVPYANKIIEDTGIITALLTAGGTPITKVILGLADGYFPSGIHHIKYYPFEVVSTIVTLTQGSAVAEWVSGVIPSAFNAAFKAVLFTDDSDVLQSTVILLDTTVAATSTTFAMASGWAGDTGDYNMMLATEADLKVLFTQYGEACIDSKIGRLASIVNCNTKEVDKLMNLVRWKLAAEIKYQKRDYNGAHTLMVNVEKECTACDISRCLTCM